MRIIQRGHIYNLDNKIKGAQELRFFKDLPHDAKDNHDGVLCQEVMRALIDRYLDLFAQVPCEETMQIIQKLRECMILAEKRAFGRTIEKAYAKMGLHVEQLSVCKNGHLFDMG